MADKCGLWYRSGRSGTRRAAGAFSLLELLTVIAIIALLLTILVPTIKGALTVTRTATSGAHLKEISKAVVNFRADASGTTTKLFAQAWQSMLKPYLSHNPDIFVCPEFADDDDDATEIALTDVVVMRVQHGGQMDYVELQDGPYMVKLSDTQFEEARNQGYLNNSNFANNFPRNDWPYQGDTDGVYWLCMEDYGGDWDFKDVMTQVRNNGDGTINLHMFSGYTCHSNTLRWKRDDSEAAYIGSNNDVGIDIPVPIEEYKNSYGMNEFVHANRFNGTKVLALDYVWIVAKASHDWSSSPGPTPGVPSFARHMDKMNVLLSGGEVVLMRPEEIDPADPLVEDYRWNK